MFDRLPPGVGKSHIMGGCTENGRQPIKTGKAAGRPPWPEHPRLAEKRQEQLSKPAVFGLSLGAEASSAKGKQVVKLICPSCHMHTVVAAADDDTRCRTCGCRLSSLREERGSPAVRGQDVLLAELREAFGLGTRGFGGDQEPSTDRSGQTGDLGGLPRETGALSAGSRVGDFEILDELGRGGMGIVYRAWQSSLDRLVALKILPGAAWRGGAAIYRFRREAQAAARLNHANVVPVYAQGEHEGNYYYAMKLVEGVSLDTAIRARPELLRYGAELSGKLSESSTDGAPANRDPRRHRQTAEDVRRVKETTPFHRSADDYRHLASLVAGVAEGLAHAHQNGVIHRDIKPHNLILGEGPRLYITDFGLAHLTSEPHLTLTGEIMGTPAYLSPEQVRGEASAIDHRTDIYSLGVALYEVITGQRPFDGETHGEILSAISTVEPRAPRALDSRIPVDLETVCLRTLQKEPAQRYPTAGALAEDLHRFAEGRPILSRRAGPIEKALKWVRRHKAPTAAVAAIVAALVVSAGWALSNAASKQREADHLLKEAHDRLVYLDYRAPELVVGSIDRAAAMGADRPKLLLAQALADLGAGDQRRALDRLESLLESEPDNIQAWYMTAWAHWRQREYERAREAFQHAEESGGPQTAEAWFFRGLAIHFDDPLEAIACYRQANLQRALSGQFFPQAVLHLARAHNQHMYATRTIGTFAEAESSLRQLIENQHYGAFPYYLLSIAYRLAAEIYEGSSGVRGDHQAGEYFAEALFWARQGQKVDPLDDRPVTAEAECLERLGDFHEAVAARTRAIELADAELKRCEGYHYRWRLHFWLGDFEAALADLESHGPCLPDSPFYKHVYPALVHAEHGNTGQALAEARALAEESPNDAQMVIWSATTLRLLGRTSEARKLLLERADQVDYSAGLHPPQSEDWVRALYALCMNEGTPDLLDQFAAEAESPWKLTGEAYFHAAAKALAEGKRNEALEGFSAAYRSFDGALDYTFHAKLLFEKLEADGDWPAWVSAVLDAAADYSGGDPNTTKTKPSAEMGVLTNGANR